MTTRRSFLLSGVASCVLALVPSLSQAKEVFAITHSDDEWRNLLTPSTPYCVKARPSDHSPVRYFTKSGMGFRLCGLSARSVLIRDKIR